MRREKWKEKAEKWKIRESVWSFLACQVSGQRLSVPEVENVGFSCGSLLYVPDVSDAHLPVPDVTVPFPDVSVNGVREMVFCDSECEFVESQTLSLSRKR